MRIIGLGGVHGDVASWAGGEVSGRDAQPGCRKKHDQQRESDAAGAISVAAEFSPQVVHGPGQPSTEVTVFAEVLLLGNENLAGIGVMPRGSPCGGKLLVGLRLVPIGVAGDQVQPLASMNVLKRGVNQAGHSEAARGCVAGGPTCYALGADDLRRQGDRLRLSICKLRTGPVRWPAPHPAGPAGW